MVCKLYVISINWISVSINMSGIAVPVCRTSRFLLNQFKKSEFISIREIPFFHFHYHSNSKRWEQSHWNILELGGQLTFSFKRTYFSNLRAWDSIVSQHIRVWEEGSNIQQKNMKYKTTPRQSEIQRGLMGNRLPYGSEGGHCSVEIFLGRDKTRCWNFKTWILSPG